MDDINFDQMIEKMEKDGLLVKTWDSDSKSYTYQTTKKGERSLNAYKAK